MDRDLTVQVERLSKAYRVGVEAERQDTLLGAVTAAIRAPLANLRAISRLGRFEEHSAERTLTNETSAATDGVHWALRDVSFEVRQGEAIGIIGRNGAGKSTLLKVLSRITYPSHGRAKIRGRVGSLLEVGTGFHPDLTGRENVYLNGTILGMTKREVDLRFDDIVSFAEVENFVDTPVKRYSSGMRVRLAFAVAASLEPEILIVDEVLAVGDTAFQRKCLGRMHEVASGGRTVLFVSHQLGSVRALCQRGIVLDRGRIVADTDANEAIQKYLERQTRLAQPILAQRAVGIDGASARLTNVQVWGGEEYRSATLMVGQPARFIFEVSTESMRLGCRFTIYDSAGNGIAHFSSVTRGPRDSVDTTERTRFVCDVPVLTLAPGRYHINVALVSATAREDHVDSAYHFDVEASDLAGRPVSREIGCGMVVIDHTWTTPS